MKQDKPLSEWTLGEVKEYCKKMHGDVCYDDDEQNDCLLVKCKLCCNEPQEMDLTAPPRFTEEEVSDAKQIYRLFPSAWERVDRNLDSSLSLDDGDGWSVVLNRTLFPSILPGQSVKLSEIVGDAP